MVHTRDKSVNMTVASNNAHTFMVNKTSGIYWKKTLSLEKSKMFRGRRQVRVEES